ncbi:hypothetical protein HZS_5941, partial [Henneguya salminicola]
MSVSSTNIISSRRSESSSSFRAKKSISFIYAFSITCGVMIGSGIFITVKESFNIFETETIGVVLVFWIMGGVISLMGGLCYAELSSRIPESGGERAYFKKVFNTSLSRTFVILSVFLLKPLTIAALAITAGKYIIGMSYSNNSSPFLEKTCAALVIFINYVLNCISKKVVNVTGLIITICKIAALLMIIGCGIYGFIRNENREWEKPFNAQNFSLKGLGAGAVSLFWTYEGWNTLGFIAGDMKNPSRDFPRAIISGCITVTLLYSMTVLSYTSVLGYSFVRGSEEIGIYVAKECLKNFYLIVPIFIALSALGGANYDVYITGCLCGSAGYSGELPKLFSLVHKKQRTFLISLAAILIVSLVSLIFDFQQLLQYCAFLNWIFYFIAFCCLWKLKLTSKEVESSKIFKTPYIIIILMQIVCIFMVVMTFNLQRIGCSLIMILTLSIYFSHYIPRK